MASSGGNGSSAGTGGSGGGGGPPSGSAPGNSGPGSPNNKEKDDEELTIPRAAMNKLIKELVPDIRVANEARELILLCCSEFIHLITTEANAICEEQQKKTMSAEHVLGAMDRLGLEEYKQEAESVLNDCKGRRKRQSTRLEHLGIPEEELLRQQQELFAKARAEEAARAHQEWLSMQSAAMMQQQSFQNLGLNASHGATDQRDTGVEGGAPHPP